MVEGEGGKCIGENKKNIHSPENIILSCKVEPRNICTGRYHSANLRLPQQWQTRHKRNFRQGEKRERPIQGAGRGEEEENVIAPSSSVASTTEREVQKENRPTIFSSPSQKGQGKREMPSSDRQRPLLTPPPPPHELPPLYGPLFPGS